MTKLRIQMIFSSFALLSLGPVMASSPVEGSVPTYTVGFSDLSLETTAGIDRLYHRIRSGATSVCRTFEGRELTKVVQHKRCMEGAEAGAVEKIANPALTAYYASQHGGQLPLSVSSTTKPPISRR